jgi:integrase/recombinase XerD
VRDLIEAFLAHLADETNGASVHTLSAYRTDLTQLTRALDGDVTRLSRPRLSTYLADRERCYAAPATVARKAACIASFCRWLVERGVLEDNPAAGLARPVGPSPVRAITDAQVDALMAAATRKGPRDAAMLRLMVCAGLTASEIVAQDVADLDLTTNYLRVSRDDYERCVPLDDDTAAVVRDHLGAHRAGLLFANHRGGPLTRQGLWTIVKGHCVTANLPADVSARTLRNVFALRLLRQQTGLRDVQALMGHAEISTTQRYLDAYRAELRTRRAAKAMKEAA